MADTASARIPKIRNKEGIKKVDISNRDVQNLLTDVNKRCLDINFHKEFVVLDVYLLHNAELQASYIKKRAEMKEGGRNPQSLIDQLGFLHIVPDQRWKLDRKGLIARSLTYNRLGKSQLGVYLNRFFDVEVKQAYMNIGPCEVKEFAVIKYFAGKCKSLNVGNIYSKSSVFEPTPNFDSHISTAAPHVDENIFAQKAKADIYLYEYNEECEPVERPRQCLPYAIVKIKRKPVLEKTVPPPPSIPLGASSRPTAESLTSGAESSAAPTTANKSKQKFREAPTLHAAPNVSQELPTSLVKDSRSANIDAKVKSKFVSKEDKHSKKYPVEESNVRDYLQRLNSAKATMEAEQSKDLEGFQVLPDLLTTQNGAQQMSSVFYKGPNGRKEQLAVPQPQLGDPRLAMSSCDAPPIQTNSHHLKPVTEQSMHEKALGLEKGPPLLSCQISSTSVEDTTPKLTPGSIKRMDPRLFRSVSNPAGASVVSRLDPRLAKKAVDVKPPDEKSLDPPCKPDTTLNVHRKSTVSHKSLMKSGTEIKKMSYSEYKKLKQDSLSKHSSEQRSALVKSKPKDSRIPQAAALPMPATSVYKTKHSLKSFALEQQNTCEENETVPLPSFYEEYTPDDEVPCPEADFNQFQSPVKQLRPQTKNSCQFQSPILKTAKVSTAQDQNSSPQAKISPLKAPKRTFLPIPVFNADGSVKNMLRSTVDGSVTEIRPSPAKDPPLDAVNKLLIKPELLNSTVKILAGNVTSRSESALRHQTSIHANDVSGCNMGSQLPSKSIVHEKSVKGLLKGFQKGMSSKSGGASQQASLVNEIPNKQNSHVKKDTTSGKELFEVSRVSNEISKDCNDQRQMDKSVLSVEEATKSPCGNDGTKQDSSELDISTGEETVSEKLGGNRRENSHGIDDKHVCVPPPLPLIPFLVSEEGDVDVGQPEECAEPEKEESTGLKENLEKESVSSELPDNDPLSSGMWLAPGIDKLPEVVALPASSTPPECPTESEHTLAATVESTTPCNRNQTNCLTMEELGFIDTLQVLSNLAFQPNTMMVDCTEAFNEKYPLDSCQMCKKLLPPGSLEYMQTFLDVQSQNDHHRHARCTSPAAESEVEGEDEHVSLVSTADTPSLEKVDESHACLGEGTSIIDGETMISPRQNETVKKVRDLLPPQTSDMNETQDLATCTAQQSKLAFESNLKAEEIVSESSQNAPLDGPAVKGSDLSLIEESLVQEAAKFALNDQASQGNVETVSSSVVLSESPKKNGNLYVPPIQVKENTDSSANRLKDSQISDKREQSVKETTSSIHSLPIAALLGTGEKDAHSTTKNALDVLKTLPHVIKGIENVSVISPQPALEQSIFCTQIASDAAKTYPKPPYANAQSASEGVTGGKISHTTEVLIPTDTGSNSHCPKEWQCKNKGPSNKSGCKPENPLNVTDFELKEKNKMEDRPYQNWVCKHPMANEVSSGSKQREQRKNILMQVLRQKERIQKDVQRHEIIKKGELSSTNEASYTELGREMIAKEKQEQENQEKHSQKKSSENVKKAHIENNLHKSDEHENSKDKKPDELVEETCQVSEMGAGGNTAQGNSQKTSDKSKTSLTSEANTTASYLEGQKQKTDGHEELKDFCPHRSQTKERKGTTHVKGDNIENNDKMGSANCRSKMDQNDAKACKDVQMKKETCGIKSDKNKLKDRVKDETGRNTKEKDKNLGKHDAKSGSRERAVDKDDHKYRRERYERKKEYERPEEKITERRREDLKTKGGAEQRRCLKWDRRKDDYSRDRKRRRSCDKTSSDTLKDGREKSNRRREDVVTKRLEKENRKRYKEDAPLEDNRKGYKEDAPLEDNRKGYKEDAPLEDNRKGYKEDAPLEDIAQGQWRKPLLTGGASVQSELENAENEEGESHENECHLPSDSNSNHLLPMVTKNLPNSVNPPSSSSSNVQLGIVPDNEETLELADQQALPNDLSYSEKQKPEDKTNSDDDFGNPTKLIQPLKKKIVINLPRSESRVTVKELSRSKAANDIFVCKSVISDSLVPSISSIASAALSSHSSHVLRSVPTQPSTVPDPDTPNEKDSTQALCIKLPETDPVEKAVEELYSPSNPTADDQGGFDKVFKGKLDSSVGETKAESSSAVAVRSGPIDDIVQKNGKDQDTDNFSLNETTGDRNLFSLYSASNLTGGHVSSTLDRNEYGDIDYRQGNSSSSHMPMWEESSGSYATNIYSTRQMETSYDDSPAPQKNMPLWSKGYDLSQETYLPFSDDRPSLSREMGCWQDSHSADSFGYGDSDYRQYPESIPPYSNKQNFELIPPYSNKQNFSPQIQSKADEDMRQGNFAKLQNESHCKTTPSVSDWRQCQNIFQNVSALYGSHTYDEYWTEPASSSTNLLSPQDKISPSDAEANQNQPLESHNMKMPASETREALKEILPEMFSPATHQQKCKNILKMFSQTNPALSGKAILPLDEGDESDDGEAPTPKQSEIRPILSKPQPEQMPKTVLQKPVFKEFSSVERLKEILANVKKKAKASGPMKTQTDVIHANQAKTLDEEKKQIQSNETELEDIGKCSDPAKSSALPLPNTDSSKKTPELASSSKNEQFLQSVDHLDQLLKKISSEGISLQNLSAVDELKNILNQLTEKLHANASDSHSKCHKNAEEVYTSMSPSGACQSDSEERGPPVVNLNQVFQTSDTGNSENYVGIASDSIKGDIIERKNNIPLQQTDCVPRASNRQENKVMPESLKTLNEKDLITSMSPCITDDEGNVGKDDGTCKSHVPDVADDDSASRLVREDDAGALLVKVSNCTRNQDTDTISLHSKSVDHDFHPKPKEDTEGDATPQRVGNAESESSDSRVIVVESSSSVNDSPQVTRTPRHSSSNLSISARDDGKVYLSDVSMDVLSFARDKILHQINELIDDTEDNAEDDADADADVSVKDHDDARAESDALVKAKGDVETPYRTGKSENDPSNSVTVENDDMEDGEIKDNECESSDDTVCRDESNLVVNISDVTEKESLCNTPVKLHSLIARKRSELPCSEDEADVIAVSSESDPDIMGQSKARRKRTTRGVFCKKDHGTLKLSPSYIENCKNKLRKKKWSRRNKNEAKDFSKNNNLDCRTELEYSDISEASNISEDLDSELHRTITSPLKLGSKVYPASPSQNKTIVMSPLKSSAAVCGAMSPGRKANVGPVQAKEGNCSEKEDSDIECESSLSSAQADSLSVQSKNTRPSLSKNFRPVDINSNMDTSGKRKPHAKWLQSLDSEGSPTRSLKLPGVSSSSANKGSDSASSSVAEKQITSKEFSAVLCPESSGHEKGRASKSPSSIGSGKKKTSPIEIDRPKRNSLEFSICVKARNSRSRSRDGVKRRRSISPFEKSKLSRRRSPRHSRSSRGRDSRSSSRSSRRDRSLSSDYSRKRMRSPRFSSYKKTRRSQSTSRSRSRSRRRYSRSSSSSPGRRYSRGHLRYSKDRYHSSSSPERRSGRYYRNSSPIRRKKRGTDYPATSSRGRRRSSSSSITPDRSVIIRRRNSFRSNSGERSPLPRKSFNNELDYYTSRQGHRAQSPVWKDLPPYGFSNSDKHYSKAVDSLDLDYFTTRKRREEDTGDRRVVQLVTPGRKTMDYEKLIKDYEKDRHGMQSVPNVTVEKFIISQFGTLIPEEVKDILPISFDCSVTHDINGVLMSEKTRGDFGKSILEAYAVASTLSDSFVCTAKFDFRSRCFDKEPGEKLLQEFSDHQVLLEVNVMKQCQAILHADNGLLPQPVGAEALLEEKIREEAFLQSEILDMEAKSGSDTSPELEAAKEKLSKLQAQQNLLKQAFIQIRATKGDNVVISRSSLPEPDLPEALRMSTKDFEFRQLSQPIPEGRVKADLENLLDQVAGDILELYKCPDFGRAHFRVPDLLLLSEEKRSLYAVCGTPLILHRPLPKRTFLSLLAIRQQLDSLGPEARDSPEAKRLLKQRSSILGGFVGMVRKPRVKKLENEMRQFACCSDFLREVLGSEGLRKLRVFETYQQALRWHFRFLDQEFHGH